MRTTTSCPSKRSGQHAAALGGSVCSCGFGVLRSHAGRRRSSSTGANSFIGPAASSRKSHSSTSGCRGGRRRPRGRPSAQRLRLGCRECRRQANPPPGDICDGLRGQVAVPGDDQQRAVAEPDELGRHSAGLVTLTAGQVRLRAVSSRYSQSNTIVSVPRSYRAASSARSRSRAATRSGSSAMVR